MESLKSFQKSAVQIFLFLFIFISISTADETLTVTPKYVNFGEVEIGETGRKVIIIKNLTDRKIKIDNMKLSNNLNFSFNKWGGNKPCKWNRWLKPDEECTVAVKFTPFKGKKYESEFVILTRDKDEIVVDLTGKGVNLSTNVPKFHIHSLKIPINKKENKYKFGKVFANDRAVEVFVIANIGNGNLVFTKPIRISDSDNFELNPFGGSRPCNSYQPVLKKNRSCTFEVYFHPTKKKSYSGELKFNTNDPKNDEYKVKLYGKGTYNAEPDIEILKSMDNFNDKEVGKESKFQISIYNYGNDVLKVDEIKIKSNNNVFKVDLKAGERPCKVSNPTIEPHNYCTVYVRFKPKEEKKYETKLVIKSNDPNDDEIKITLKGKGVKEKDIMNLNLKDEFTNGCSIGAIPSFPFYLLVPFIVLFRKLRYKKS